MTRNKLGNILIAAAAVMIAASAAISGYNLIDEKRAADSADELTSKLGAIIPERPSGYAEAVKAAAVSEENGDSETASYETDAAKEEKADDSAAVLPDTPAKQTQTVTIDGGSYIGMIEIPEIDLKLAVGEDCSSLRLSPCRWSGSALTGDLVIAGHNYKRHFGGLNRLEAGDEVSFTDVDGYVYHYKVKSAELIAADDVEAMLAGDWDLTLFTCDYTGQNRLAVRCELSN